MMLHSMLCSYFFVNRVSMRIKTLNLDVQVYRVVCLISSGPSFLITK